MNIVLKYFFDLQKYKKQVEHIFESPMNLDTFTKMIYMKRRIKYIFVVLSLVSFLSFGQTRIDSISKHMGLIQPKYLKKGDSIMIVASAGILINRNEIIDEAQKESVELVDDKEGWSVPSGIIAMLLGCLMIYSIMFCTGYFIYGDYILAFPLIAISLISAFFLIKIWKKVKVNVL